MQFVGSDPAAIVLKVRLRYLAIQLVGPDAATDHARLLGKGHNQQHPVHVAGIPGHTVQRIASMEQLQISGFQRQPFNPVTLAVQNLLHLRVTFIIRIAPSCVMITM